LEDNVGALNLAKKEPGRTTPRSKFYAVKYHWFHSLSQFYWDWEEFIWTAKCSYHEKGLEFKGSEKLKVAM